MYKPRRPALWTPAVVQIKGWWFQLRMCAYCVGLRLAISTTSWRKYKGSSCTQGPRNSSWHYFGKFVTSFRCLWQYLFTNENYHSLYSNINVTEICSNCYQVTFLNLLLQQFYQTQVWPWNFYILWLRFIVSSVVKEVNDGVVTSNKLSNFSGVVTGCLKSGVSRGPLVGPHCSRSVVNITVRNFEIRFPNWKLVFERKTQLYTSHALAPSDITHILLGRINIMVDVGTQCTSGCRVIAGERAYRKCLKPWPQGGNAAGCGHKSVYCAVGRVYSFTERVPEGRAHCQHIVVLPL
jgi:hypothetical protein